ncbi:MAG: M48 family metallopeptidase [Planctomycetota bacterium]|jgi:predicted Zn-dependent protease
MKITARDLGDSADVSSAKGTAFRELKTLLIATCILAVAVYLAVGLIVDTLVPCISYKREAKLFSGLARHIGKADSDRLEQAKSILDVLIKDPNVPPLPYRVVLITEDQINAFAFPGGTIGVTEGLLDNLHDDISLAFVLGHELGHFRHRDHLRGIGRAVGVGVSYAILFGGQMGNESMGTILSAVLRRGYSRRQERHADHFGIDLVFRTYGRTEGVDELFRLIEIKDDMPAWCYMFATHPQPKTRIQELKRYADQLAQKRADEVLH